MLRAAWVGALSWCKIQVFRSGSSSFLTNFVDKASQESLVEELVNCLPLRNKLMMHQSVMVKEGDPYLFHLWTLHAGLLWSGWGRSFPPTTLSFCFWIILKDPSLVSYDDVFQEFVICFQLLKDVSACIQSLNFLLLSQFWLPWYHFGTHLQHKPSQLTAKKPTANQRLPMICHKVITPQSEG